MIINNSYKETIIMQRKIAILRGINVGGKKKILMSDLKGMFEALEFSNVVTYIQSGNVIFDSKESAHTKLAEQIRDAIKNKFGFEVPVVIRTVKELKQATESNPYYTSDSDINKLHLTFLNESPSEENIKETERYDYAPDLFTIKDKDVFIYCEGKYHQSKLSNAFFEKKLKVEATTRNWKTVLKLVALGGN